MNIGEARVLSWKADWMPEEQKQKEPNSTAETVTVIVLVAAGLVVTMFVVGYLMQQRQAGNGPLLTAVPDANGAGVPVDARLAQTDQALDELRPDEPPRSSPYPPN